MQQQQDNLSLWQKDNIGLLSMHREMFLEKVAGIVFAMPDDKRQEIWAAAHNVRDNIQTIIEVIKEDRP